MNTRTTLARTHTARLTIEIMSSGAAVRVVLHGAADPASSDVLGAALAALDVDSVESVQVEATDVSLVDVAAIRHLVLFVRRMRQEGRDAQVTGGPSELRETARLLGVDGELGLA